MVTWLAGFVLKIGGLLRHESLIQSLTSAFLVTEFGHSMATVQYSTLSNRSTMDREALENAICGEMLVIDTGQKGFNIQLSMHSESKEQELQDN